MAENNTTTSGGDTSHLQAQLDALTTKLHRTEAELVDNKKKFGWITDPEAVKAKLEDYENLRKDATGGDKVKIDQLIAEKSKELEGRFSGKLTEFETENQTLKKELKSLRVTNVAMQEAAKHFNADGLPLLQHIIEQNTDYVDGQIVVLDNGKPAVSKRDPRKQMDLAEYMEGLAVAYPSLAKATIVSGGKPTGNMAKSGGAKLSIQQYAQLNANDQQAYVRGLDAQEQKQFLNSLLSR